MGAIDDSTLVVTTVRDEQVGGGRGRSGVPPHCSNNISGCTARLHLMGLHTLIHASGHATIMHGLLPFQVLEEDIPPERMLEHDVPVDIIITPTQVGVEAALKLSERLVFATLIPYTALHCMVASAFHTWLHSCPCCNAAATHQLSALQRGG